MSTCYPAWISSKTFSKSYTTMQKYAEIGCLLLDRGFNSVANYKLLEDGFKIKYIMPQIIKMKN